MLTLLDGDATAAHTVASLRAACAAVCAGAGAVTAITVSGRLPLGPGTALPVLAAAERLAADHDCSVTMRLDGGTFLVRFSPEGVRREDGSPAAG